MNTQSEAALAGVCLELKERVREAARVLETEGTCLLVVSGLRDSAQQNALYAQGRTAPGHIVTNAPAGLSMHNYGLAVDVVPYLSGQSGVLNWNPATLQFQRMVTAMKAQHLIWGGDWKGGLGDFDHFQLPELPPSPSIAMRSDYWKASGKTPDLTAIWHKAELGKYAV